jgi:hypothetical protein
MVKRDPSDIDTAVAGSLKALDPERPIREADITGHTGGSMQQRLPDADRELF